MKNRLLWSILLLGCLVFNACSDEEDPFAGKDNFITSFSLSQDNENVNAVILDDEIIVYAPLDYSPNGAKANVVLSENAKIMPDPNNITDWSSEHVFVVTSFNGEKRSYTYKYVNDESNIEGSVVLTTQSEVDAFGQSGVTSIRGSLIIGTASGRDLITSIAALNSIKEVGYGVVIKSTYDNETLDGLTALQTIGGALQIENSGLKEAKLTALKSAGSIVITSKTLEKLECPNLTEVSGGLNFMTINLSKINAPILETVGANITFDVADRQKDISMLQEISFPALKDIKGSFLISSQANIGKIELLELIRCKAITIERSASLTVPIISMPKLEECKGQLKYDQLSKLQELSFPSLTHLGSFVITSCGDMETISMPKLKEVTGDFKPGAFTNIAPNGFKDFKELTTIGGLFEIKYGYETTLKSLMLPPALKSCKTLDINDCPTIETLDVSGIAIEELILSKATLINLTVKGDRVFNGKLHIDGHENSNIVTAPYEYKMPKLDGIEEVGGLTISPSYYGYMPDITITSIKKVNGDFELKSNAGRLITKFQMATLTEVSGNLIIASVGKTCDFEFTALKKVGGDIIFNDFDGQTARFPVLDKVSSMVLTVGSINFESVVLPKLTTITGELRIACRYTNTSLVNLAWLDKLQAIGNVHIENMMALTSYEGLKGSLNSLTSDDQWTLINNKYMPTLAEMKAGNWNE